jgi:hypothetical protein
MRGFMICMPHQASGSSDPAGWGGGKWHIEMHSDFWWGNPKETDHVAKLGRDVRRILKWILQKQNRWV